MSKGSKQRPTDYEKFSRNYDEIFRKGKQNVQPAPECPLLEYEQTEVEDSLRVSISGTVSRKA